MSRALMDRLSPNQRTVRQKQILAAEWLVLRQIPARLTTEQVAWVLNCQPHDIPVLVAAKLLKPLGNPPQNSVKFDAALEVLEQAKDRTWLAKVTNAVTQHWQTKNAAKKHRLHDDHG